jgi:iron complex outermembrane receptor protein
MSGEDNSNTTVFAALDLPTNPNETNARVATRSPAEYAQGTVALSPTVNVTAGVRWTSETKEVDPYRTNPTGCQVPAQYRIPGECLARFPTHDENLSYTVGPDWTIAPGIMLYAKTSRGFKSGGINQRVTNNPLSVAYYRPEEAIDYELGIKSQWLENRLRINGAYYHTDYRDIQRTVTECAPTCFSLTGNAARALIDGVELDATALPYRNLEIRVTGAFTDARYTEFEDAGIDQSFQRFPNTPRWTYSTSAAYTVPTHGGGVRGQLDWSWRGTADLSPEDSPGTVAIVNGAPTAGPGTPDAYRIQRAFGLLNGQLKLDRTTYTIALYGRNILNAQYLSHMLGLVNAGLGYTFAVPGEPRTVGVEFRMAF